MKTAAQTTPAVRLPRTLPTDASGFTKTLRTHLRGIGWAAAEYTIHDSSGQLMPFSFAYNTDKKKPSSRGFYLEGTETCLSWAQLVEAWPAYVAQLEFDAQLEEAVHAG